MSTVEMETSKLKIPTARSPEAKMIVDGWEKIKHCLAKSGISESAFLTPVIIELNQLNSAAVCDKDSVMSSVFNLGEMGLLVGSTTNHAHFAARSLGKDKPTVLRVELMYQGYMELAFENGFLKDVHTDVVLKGEECKRWTDEQGPKIRHELPDDREVKWDDVIGAYCIWHSRNGGYGVQWSSRGDLAKVNNGSYVWKKYPGPMCQKTPLKRAARSAWSTSSRLRLALAIDDCESDVQPSNYVPEKSPAIDLENLD